MSAVDTLLRTAFPNRDGEVWIEWGHFNPHLVIEGRGRVAGVAMSMLPDDGAVYYCAGLLKSGGTRRNEDVESVHVLTIDDVGTKIVLDDMDRLVMLGEIPAPTVKIETSPGNFQWQYLMPRGMDPDTYRALRRSMKAHPVYGHSEAIAPSNLVRLPMGVNGKPGVVHDVVDREWAAAFDPDALIKGFGGLTVTVAQMKRTVASLRAPNDAMVEDILKLLPNDGTAPYCDSNQAWFDFGQALHGATGGERLDLWQDWCAQQDQGVDVEVTWNRMAPHSLGWPTLVKWADERRLRGEVEPGALARALFNDGEIHPVDNSGDEPVDIPGIDPASKPKVKYRRPWLYGHRLIRGYLSSTVAAGGTGKSSLTMVEAVAMVTKRDLLDVGRERMPRDALRVLVWNGEDPKVELDLRLEAIQKHYGVPDAELGGLFLVSGRQMPLRISHAQDKGVARLKAMIRHYRIDVMMVDPFVSSHGAQENDNMAIDGIAKAWSAIAEDCGCAVDLVHHIRKPQAANGHIDLTVDDARGASALVNASRNARVLSPMGDKVAVQFGIANRRAYFAIQHDATKANMVPGMVGTDWYHFASVDMGNGEMYPLDGGQPIPADNVGVVERWMPSTPVASQPANIVAAQAEIAKGSYRMSSQSKAWVGAPIADALGMDARADRRVIDAVVREWVRDGWLVVVEKLDSHREMKEFVEVGNAPEVPEF